MNTLQKYKMLWLPISINVGPYINKIIKTAKNLKVNIKGR
jgi:hypothetical protein